MLGELGRLVDGGLPVLWIAGNHDCWGGEVLRRDIGVTYHEGPWRGTLGGWDTLIEHGDGLREKEDAPYRRLRAVLRHPWAIARIAGCIRTGARRSRCAARTRAGICALATAAKACDAWRTRGWARLMLRSSWCSGTRT